MMWRWFTLVFIAALLWQLPKQRTVIVVRDGGGDRVVAPEVRASAVNRALVALAIDDPQTFTAGTRPVPFLEDGAPAGYVLYAVTSGSLPAELGLASGDVVRRINGLDIASPALPDTLRAADRITLEILRNGEPRELAYEVQD